MPEVANLAIDRFTVATPITLESLAQGQVMDQFQWCFAKVLEDIADENTTADVARSIDIKIVIKPSVQRSHANGKATVKCSSYPNGRAIEFELNLHRTANSISASETYVEQGYLDV